jgi:alpha-glucosidase
VAPGGWPCWALSNHDVVRVASRWGGADKPAHPNLLRLGAALQMSLRGSPCIYQGDELGLPEVEIAFEDMQDPYGITMWPEFKGRDGCRTTMPWSATEPDMGFSTVSAASKPWLPVAEPHRTLAVDLQESDSNSLLHFYRQLLQWRKTQAVLVHGSLDVLPAHPQVLAFVRSHGAQRLLCIFNFSDSAVNWSVPTDWQGAKLVEGSGLVGAVLQSAALQLAPWGGAYLQP